MANGLTSDLGGVPSELGWPHTVELGRVAPETSSFDRGIVIWLVIKAFYIDCSIINRRRQSAIGRRLVTSR